MAIQFIYFDLGKVLVHFERDQMFDQVAALAGLERATVAAAFFGDGLHNDFESGRISPDEYLDGFCRRIDRTLDGTAFFRAATEFFCLNTSILPVISGLRQTRQRIGILSNTAITHWEYCRDRWRMLDTCFDIKVLSYEFGAMKPDGSIYRHAADRAGVAPEEVFFTDDLPENVEGALAAGLDAVPFTGAPALAGALRQRGIPLNY